MYVYIYYVCRLPRPTDGSIEVLPDKYISPIIYICIYINIYTYVYIYIYLFIYTCIYLYKSPISIRRDLLSVKRSECAMNKAPYEGNLSSD